MLKKESCEYIRFPIEWGFLAAVLFFLSFIPDEKLIRLKLEWLEIGICTVCSLWALKQCIKGDVRFRISAIHLPVMLWIIYNVALYAFSAQKPIAMLELRRMILMSGVFLCAANILADVSMQRKLMQIWLAGIGIIAVYGILQRYGGIWILQVPRMARVMGTSGNPIFFSAYLLPAVPILLSLFVKQTHTAARWYLCGILCAVMTAVLFTKTRAAYLALLIGMLLWFFLFDYLKQWETMQWLYRKKWMCLIIAAGIVPLCFYCGGFDYFFALARRQQAHLVIWRDTLRMWLTAPVIGKGLGVFPVYFTDFASAQLKSIWPQNQFIVNDAHNEYIQILAETGIIGLVLFMWIVTSFFVVAWKSMRLNGCTAYPAHRMWLVGLMVSSTVLLIQNFFSVDMRFAISGSILFLIFGMVAAVSGREYHVLLKRLPVLQGVLIVVVVAGSVYLFVKIVAPYHVQKKLAQEVDFFDKKVLEPAKTIEELEILSRRYPDKASIFEKLGWVYAKEKQWDAAIRNYLKAVELNPQLAGAYNNLGNIHFQINKKEKALDYYQKALEIDTTLLDAHINAGILYYYDGKLRQSAEHMNRVLALDPDNTKAQAVLQRINE